jgi:hypothetical protein
MIQKEDGSWAIFEGANVNTRDSLTFDQYDGNGRFIVNYVGEGDDGYEHETGYSTRLSPAQKQAIRDYFPDQEILHVTFEPPAGR